jgi:hypothetical protein
VYPATGKVKNNRAKIMEGFEAVMKAVGEITQVELRAEAREES